MAYGYLGRLEESFDKMLLEAQQVVIDFKAIYGADAYEEFKRAKQRLSAPENDISYWVGRYKKEGDVAKRAFEAALGGAEGVKRDIEGKVIPEPADMKELIAENDFYSAYNVDDWTDMVDLAMRKIDGFAGAYWCIAGRYQLDGAAEEAGIDNDDAVKLSQAEHFFNSYLDGEYRAYVVCMPKDRSHQKYCVCLNGDGDYFTPWSTYDERNVDDDFEDIPHFSVCGVSFEGTSSTEYAGGDGEEPDEDAGPHEWTDENGNAHVGEEPPAPRDPEMIHVDNPNSLEFRVGTKEDAVKAFKDSGVVDGVEFVEDIPGTPICIVKFEVEPTHEEFPQEGDDVYVRDLPGDRYTPFIFMPGDGGGPLLTQQGDIVAHRTVEGAKGPFVREFRQDQVFHQGEEPRRPEPEGEEGGLEESYWAYAYPLDESCGLKEEEKGEFVIRIGDEDAQDIDGNVLVFDTELKANEYALSELELLQNDYTVMRK